MRCFSRFMLLLLVLGLVVPLNGSVAAAAAPKPVVTLSPAAGTAGEDTTLTATGLPRSRKGALAFAGTKVAFRTDSSGRLSRTLTVPPGATGVLSATVAVGRSRASALYTVLAPTPESPPEVTTALRFGVSLAAGSATAVELADVAELAGEAPSIGMFYRGFADQPHLGPFEAIAATGATPLLTWEPYDHTRGVDQPEFGLARLRDGSHDAHVRRWAETLRDWGQPVMLRFAHEMNGDWYPWAESVNGNRPGDYVATWRHIHDIFEAAGADNVSWVWSPNVSHAGLTPLAGLYPGDAYVDWVALDGYNWGTSVVWGSWASPSQIFDASLAELAVIAPGKPVMLAETASSEHGGDKAMWIGELFVWLGERPQIGALVWFNHDKETDWRIGSSPASASAFAAGLARSRR